MNDELRPGVDLYWLPLGAGGHSVRLNGRVFEAVAARLERRNPRDLYHSALEVRAPEGRFVIEQAPACPNGDDRGVVAEGAVGARWAGRFRLFRYEIRRWQDGEIPDMAEAVDSPLNLTTSPAVARRILDVVADVPTPVWGRDEIGAGEMWNSNSVISWLIERSGLDAGSIQPPAGGRAPGWAAGLALARLQKKVKRVLVATDGSASAVEAVEFAIDLALEHDAHLIVAHVAPERDVLPVVGFAGGVTSLPHELDEYDREPLAQAEQLAETRGVPVTTKLLTGNPVQAIAECGDAVEADLILVGCREHGAVASALLGSVSRGVRHRARRPVHVIRRPIERLRSAA